jgi:hypothetical protein
MIEKEKVIAWIDRKKWIFAKTYAKTTPHEYIWRDYLRSAEDRNMYGQLFEIIKSEGVWEPFFRTKFKYWYCGEYKYWTMGDNYEENQVINRAKAELKYC